LTIAAIIEILEPGGKQTMGAVAAGAVAAMIQAAKASGVIVRIEPSDFAALAAKVGDPLVVASRGGFFNKYFDYLMSYKGLAFYTRSPDSISLPSKVELVTATKIWIPGN
jgi:hypothetical protein